jgi:catechol 2,3-dioxygenase-like lactoylglutathione lyase family enzyme
MKRFHVHLHVQDLQASLAFYTRLFGASPARVEVDYAKWMLEDPRLNFAISTRGSQPGLDHLGFQVDSADELAGMRAAAERAEMSTLDEGETTCCYARSEKHWITDPQGVAWEHFHTLADIPVFQEASPAAAGACCAPAAKPTTACCTPVVAASASCCGPASSSSCC